jgi:guanylate kinase
MDASFPSAVSELRPFYAPGAIDLCLRHRSQLEPLHEAWLKALRGLGGPLVPSGTEAREVLGALEQATRSRLAALRGATDVVLGICGAGAVGKDTLKAALARGPLRAAAVVNTTTRPMREGERDGVDYHFVSEQSYGAMERDGRFVVTAFREGRGHYGITRDAIEQALDGRSVCMVEESPANLRVLAERLAALQRRVLLVYVLPPPLPLVHLAARLFTREVVQPTCSDGSLSPAAIESTLGLRQVREFREAAGLAQADLPLVFVVNDAIERMASVITRSLLG